MKDLGELDNGFLAQPFFAFGSMVFGLNNRGPVTKNMMPDNQTVHAFFWDGEKLDDFGTFGGSISNAVRINDKGEVVGNSLTAGDKVWHSLVTKHGTMIDLVTTGGYDCNVALGINESLRSWKP